MLEKIIKDYFSFTRKERVAVIILASLVIITFLLPYWVPEPGSELGKTGFDTLKLQLDPLKPVKEDEVTANNKEEYDPDRDRKKAYSSGWLKKEEPMKNVSLFYFDPNTLSAEGWKKLGLRDKTIATIQNYVSKGGRFKKREDIEKIYGLHKNELELLMPYVKIADDKTTLKNDRHETAFTKSQPTTYGSFPKKTAVAISSIDINTGDSTVLTTLPGIGSKLAARIIHFREKLGGFYSIDQLSEIYGLPDSTFQMIRPFLTIGNMAIQFINVNVAQATDLQQHPYIKWNMAKAIVEYRNQHGNFKNPEDLQKINLISDEQYRKLAPYLKIE